MSSAVELPDEGTTVIDKTYLIVIRFLAIASFATSIFSCFSSHHNITINEHPYVETLYGIQCESLTGDSRDYCLKSTNTRYYTLFRSFDNFFSIADWDGGVLCGSREFDLPDGVPKDIATIVVGNLGKCTETVANVVQCFSILSCVFASFLTIYITVLADDALLQTKFAPNYHAGMVMIMLSNITLFQHCEQEIGVGFWFQVTTLALACINTVLALTWSIFGTPPGTFQAIEAPLIPKEVHPPFYTTLHFYVQIIRFSELAILFIGVVSPFTRVQTTFPVANPSRNSTNLIDQAFGGVTDRETDTEISLWQGLFCHPFGSRLFLWSVVLSELGVEEKSFGECEGMDLFEVQLGCILAMITATTAMTFQKDAKTMPLMYMVGFVMHFLSMVKLSWAIGAFMTKVFPGRKGINPSYCSLWEEYLEGSACSIEVGQAIYLVGAALGTVAVSFVGEVIVQKSFEHGIGSAYRTLIGRVRQGRLRDLGKPTSERVLDVAADDSYRGETDDDNVKGIGVEAPRWITVFDSTKSAPSSLDVLASGPQDGIDKKSNTKSLKKVVVNGRQDDNSIEPLPCSMTVIFVVLFLVLISVLLVVLLSVLVMYGIQSANNE